jgi:Fur family transcriptional regulator, ferric uptake regulator
MDKCNAKETLKANNIRITRQRLELTQSILDFEHPFSVTDIYAINSHIVDLATAYRFIRILQENLVIRPVAQIDDTQFFELACEHNPNHPHFLCKSCHHLTCLNTLRTSDVLRLAEYARSQSVDDVAVTYRGTCRECADKLNKEGNHV